MADDTGTGGPDGPWAAPGRSRARTSPTAGSDDLRTLLDADDTAIVMLGSDGSVEELNSAMLALLGVDTIGQVRAGGRSHAAITAFLDQLPRQLRTGAGGSWRGDVDHPTVGGDALTLRVTAHATPAGGGRSSIALLLHDVSDERRALSALKRRATHDHLTGLAHRDRFMSDLAVALAERRDRPQHVAALSIDLDRLRRVNDVLGLDAGDQLLTAAAQRLEQLIGPRGQVARVGGDEFLAMCVDLADRAEALDLAERTERALRGSVSIEDRTVEFGASVGVALTDAGPTIPEQRDGHVSEALDDVHAAASLVAASESAMREAKRRGGTRAVLHDDDALSAGSVDRQDFVASLALAISDHGLTVDYQPVFSTISKRAVGAEALARWRHPTRGPIDPATFIVVAEEAGLIGRLGAEVLDIAIGDLRRWIDTGVVDDGFAIHVNVSASQLASGGFVDSVLEALGRHGCTPAQLVLEARESSFSSPPADVDRSIRTLRRHGVNVAVDDFGTGAQALGIMTGIGADVVKLDGSLALPTGSSDAQARLVRAVILFAHALDMGVVAERVSGVEQLRRLEAVGCDMVQGNLLGEPCRADEFVLTSSVSW